MAILVTYPSKMTFVHLKKNAGTSVTKWLFKNTTCNKLGAKHCSFQRLEQNTNRDIMGFTFCIIRNPFARVVSSYNYHIKQIEDRIEKYKKGATRKESYKAAWAARDTYKISFEEWLDTDPSILSDIQAEKINRIDCILRLENINEDFKIIQEKLNCFDPLPNNNVTIHDHYKTFYNQTTRKIVEDRCSLDFKTYGYNF